MAPFDGTVVAVNESVGAQASGNSSVLTLLNPDLIRIDASVDQTEISNIHVAQPATASFDALPGIEYAAVVSLVGITPTTSQGVVTYVVNFAFAERLPSGAPLPSPGMTALIDIITSRVENALVVPSRAVSGRGRNTAVTVRAPAGDEVRPVTTGLTDGTLTEILTGLQDGEEVLYTTSVASTTGTPSQQTNPFGGGGGGGGGRGGGGGFGGP